MNYVAKTVANKGEHGIEIVLDGATIYLLLFAYDVALVSDTVVVINDQLNVLQAEAKPLGFVTNQDKSNIFGFPQCRLSGRT